MATLQQIEDGIRRLHAQNPNDPRIAQLGKARADMLAGGGGGEQSLWQKAQGYTKTAQDYIEGTAKNFADPSQWSKAMENPVVTSLQNPQQAVPDILRTGSNFATMGLRDRAAPLLTGRTHEQEKALTSAADTRLGTLDEAVNMGAAMATPGLGMRAGEGVGALGRAGIYGGEGAGRAGIQANIEGEDPKRAMIAGAAGGAGGSVLGDMFSAFRNAFSRQKPQFRTDEDLFKAADTTARNTRAGRDLGQRADLVERVRLAQTKGPQGFKDILSSVEGYGRKKSGMSREMVEDISTAANQPNAKKQAWNKWGDVVQGGTSWGRLPVATASVGVAPIAGAWMKGRAAQMSEVDPVIVERIKAKLRSGGGAGNALTPEETDIMRNAVAKAGMTAGRTGPQ